MPKQILIILSEYGKTPLAIAIDVYGPKADIVKRLRAKLESPQSKGESA